MKLTNQQAEALASQIIRKANETREKEQKAYLTSKTYKDAIAKDYETAKKQLPKTGILADFISEDNDRNYGFSARIKTFLEKKHAMKENQYTVKAINRYQNHVKEDLIVASIGAEDTDALLKVTGYTL